MVCLKGTSYVDVCIVSAVISNGVAAEFLTELSNQLSSDLTNQLSNELSNELIAAVEQQILYSNESLVFHEKCGSLIKLSNSRRTAERRRPLDEFNNGVVMTNRPLRNDELFEVGFLVLHQLDLFPCRPTNPCVHHN